MSYSMETLREVWDDKHGDRVEVGPDRDGLGLVEIRYVESGGKIVSRMQFPTDQASLIAEAVRVCASEVEEMNEEKA